MAADSAQYAIQIASSMPEGATTLEQLDELTAKLMGGGKNADFFQQAMKQVSDQLGAAKVAALAANTALEEGEAEYKKLERAALQTAKAAEKAAKGNAGVVPHELAAQAAAAALAVDHYAEKLKLLEKDAHDAGTAETELGRTLENVKKLNDHTNRSIEEHGRALAKLRGSLRDAGGPLGTLADSLLAPTHGFAELSGEIGSIPAAAALGIVSITALAATIVGVGVVAGVGLLAIAKWAVGISDKSHFLESRIQKVHDNFTNLFSGLNIDPVLNAFDRVADFFDETNASGATIKFLFETLFQPLIDQAERATVVLEAFALGFLIGMLKLYIALKPVIKAVADFLGFDDLTLGDTLEIVTIVGEYAATAFAALVIVLGGLLAVVLAVSGAIAGVYVGALYAITAAADAVVSAISAAVSWIRAIDFGALGADILRGIASGVTSAAGFLQDAIHSAINGAIRSAKALLGIASKSKVFAQMGEYTGEGFAAGVERSSDGAQSALADMVSPLAAQDTVRSSAQSFATPAARAAPSVSVVGPFNFYGVKDAEAAQDSWGEVLTRILEGDAATLGSEALP